MDIPVTESPTKTTAAPLRNRIAAGDSDIRALTDRDRVLLARALDLLAAAHKAADDALAGMPDGPEKDKLRARLVHAAALRFAVGALQQTTPTDQQMEALLARVAKVRSFVNLIAGGAKPPLNLAQQRIAALEEQIKPEKKE